MSLDHFRGSVYFIRKWMRETQAEIDRGERRGARSLRDLPDIPASHGCCPATVGWPTPHVLVPKTRSNPHKE